MRNKIRIILTITTIVVVATLASIVGKYAKGYRFDPQTLKFVPNGILVVNATPSASEVYVDGEFQTATDATIRLAPGTYDVRVQKEGYIAWNKRLTIEKEVVTEANVELFRSAPSLTAITFSGVVNPIPSDDHTRIAFSVPPSTDNGQEKSGLWVMETSNLPLGFSRDPKRITDGDLTKATWQWSPNGNEILLTTNLGSYVLNSGEFTPQAQRVNIASTKEEILKEWNADRAKKLEAKVKSLPQEIQDLFTNKVSKVEFSPDDDKALYTASGSATLDNELIKMVPGASTQKQERDIKPGRTYVYDIKEDRNFLIEKDPSNMLISWFATSNHVLIAEKGNVSIMDIDGTNKQSIYSGAYEAPNAFPTLNTDRILILTDLGGGAPFPNLYSLSVK